MKLSIFSLLALVLLSGSAMAQSFEVKGGVNVANVSVTDNGNVDDAKQLTSFNVGVVGVFPLGTKVVSIQPGVFYTGKGSELTAGNTSSTTYSVAKFNPRYIEVPVNLVFTLPLGDKNGVFLGAGPYAAMGVGGKSTVDGQLAGVSFHSEKSIKFSNDDPTTSGEEGAGYGILRRFDYGLNGIAGIEVQKAIFSVGYGLGLAKLQSGSNSSANQNNKHRVWNFSVGYRF